MPFSVIHPDPITWDSFVEQQQGHLLQTSAWGELKSAFGWQAEVIAVAMDDDIRAGALMLHRTLPAGLGVISYVPRGPVIDWKAEAALMELLAAIDQAAQAKNAVLLKLEPDLWQSEAAKKQLQAVGFHVSQQTIQPPSTIVIDITPDEDAILANMSQSTRRKVRLPYRREIEFRRGTRDDLESFSALIDVTGTRDAFGVHEQNYYTKAFDLYAPKQCALLMASYQGMDVAGLMAFSQGQRSWYLYGASSNRERNRMPTYGIQLEAIRWAKKQGCTEYDLWGIPDEPEDTLEAQFQERSEGLWGVYGFKRGFGGTVKRTVGAWDKVYRPVAYQAYKAALRARALL